MLLVTQNSEARLLELVRALKGDPAENYAVHFHLSQLQDEYRSDFQIKIAVNILNDVFRQSDGTIFLSRNGDVFVVYHGNNRALLEKGVFQVRYLFMDDPLASYSDGTENENFCTLYDLGFQWRHFHRLCSELLGMAAQAEILEEGKKEKERKHNLTPERLVRVLTDLEKIDLGLAIRQQPVCAKTRGQDMRIVYEEIYINISHLNKLLGGAYNLASDRGLFKHLTLALDKHILETISARPIVYLKHPVSININLETVLSENFSRFNEKIKAISRSSIVLEIAVADVFSAMSEFLEARKLAQNMGYRICLDGLTNQSFTQVDRASLGFDLAKLQWNADMEGDLGTEENQKLAAAIRKCGSNRMILCRCDSRHAIDYGHALDISLFQGRYPDRMINPDSSIVN